MILTEEFRFSDLQITSLWAIAGACILLPILYAIYFGFKRKLNWIAVLVGVVVGTLVALSPNNSPNIFLHAIWAAVEECAAMYISLRIIGNFRDSTNTPAGLGLGWVIFPLVIVKGMQAISAVSSVQLFNDMGLTEILNTLPETEHEAFRESLIALAEEPVVSHVMLALKCAASFALAIGLSRILWYSLKGARRAPHWGFIVVAVVLSASAEIFYQTSDSIAAQCAYYVTAALTLAVSIYAASKWDAPVQFTERLSRKKL